MESGEFVVISDYDVRMKQEKRWSLLSQLLADPILADALRNPTLSYVVTLVSLEKGSAMRLSIVKLDGSSLGNVLLYWHFVEHLVFFIKKRVNEMEQANMEAFVISRVLFVGVRNKSQIASVPYVTKKGLGRHSKRKKHHLFRSLHKIC
ncbi:hypothetical protein Bca4012_076261 [Brassica carinata]|uniref:Uncharacterized protein n=1 Tax=Brassica carinata TaxID=52824 RepID=A0A8X7QB05_BRACI|nr:hypothetical protein Bca52824_073372 [Brassica carinata]